MQTLVTAEEALGNRGLVRFIDARRDAEAYATAHVAGAVHADLETDLSAVDDPAAGGRHPLPTPAAWAATLGAWGITPETQVYVYDDTGGAVAAARTWWMLHAAGHRRAAVVDGGWAALCDAGAPLSNDAPEPADTAPGPFAEWQLPTVDFAEVADRRERADSRLIDVRAAKRWRGDTEPLDPVAGHIPGSVNLPLTENLGPDGHFLPAAELRATYLEALGGVPPERAILQCGSGVTACHGLLAMAHAGLPGAALYVGSWSEWCRRVP
ncbi:MAG: sulfurtransferase [Sandaracinus sp.]|nr:sulfurtransferase [Sandaracinus sp.]|tara:strand:- start:230 stop:1033 length:804 start_codon:yes stop_codon:yes gene_type:complete